LDDLRSRQIQFDYLTLHVGLGTFKPVTAATAQEHDMHEESFVVSVAFLGNLIQNLHKTIIPSGTTAMRVLESLYYIGAAVLCNKPAPQIVPRDAGFNPEFQGFDTAVALEAAVKFAMQNGGIISGKTSIFILPGFVFRFSKALITNLHQPGSTLLLLVAAFIGPVWRQLYAEGLASGYRFLSYGDAMFLRPGTDVKGK
jgi:S-adenosylmethionine:tRNA ribosyltransferase-isomerase